MPIGTVRIQIPFTDLRVIIDVDFLINTEAFPTLLSMQEMVRNQLHIYIQHGHISFSERIQPLAMENRFLIHRWTPMELPYALYIAKEQRSIHRSFGNPSIRSTEGLLQLASRGPLAQKHIPCRQNITAECQPCTTQEPTSRIFKLPVGMDYLRFNHSV